MVGLKVERFRGLKVGGTETCKPRNFPTVQPSNLPTCTQEKTTLSFERLIELDRCRVGSGTFVQHGDHEFAVFQLPTGEPVVIDNTCPHAGGNLAGGTIDGHIITCPLHQWRFDLSTGQCVSSPKAHVNRYRACVRDGVIYVDL